MNTYKRQYFTEGECLTRRYWIQIASNLFADDARLSFKARILRSESEKNLIGLVFREERVSHTLNYKSTDLDKILRIYKLVERLMGGNGYSQEAVQITVQPLCKNCGALLRFSSKVCKDCGSRNIEPSGVYNVESQRIIFKRGGNG